MLDLKRGGTYRDHCQAERNQRRERVIDVKPVWMKTFVSVHMQDVTRIV